MLLALALNHCKAEKHTLLKSHSGDSSGFSSVSPIALTTASGGLDIGIGIKRGKKAKSWCRTLRYVCDGNYPLTVAYLTSYLLKGFIV